MNRLDSCFHCLRIQQRKAFVAYLVAGDPHPDDTPALVQALESAGADIIELGVPFSDPLADGAVNQLGSQRALQAGTNLATVLHAVRAIRHTSQIPVVLFTYYNPVFHYGPRRFADDAAAAGVDGVLVLDLPPEEAREEWAPSSTLRRISLIAPTTPSDRIASITAQSSGFIYYVSREGVTGMQQSLPAGVEEQLARIRACSDLPICVGFGISSPDQARTVASWADGVVVGSSIVHQIGQWGRRPDLPQLLAGHVRPLADAIHGPSST